MLDHSARSSNQFDGTKCLHSSQLRVSVIPPCLQLVRAEELSWSKLIALYRLVARCPAALPIEEAAFRGVNQQPESIVTLRVSIDVVGLVTELRYQRGVLYLESICAARIPGNRAA